MLILSRKPGESIVIDGRIIVKIVRLEGDIVKLGIEAPAEIPVHRQEVYAEIQKNNQEAMTNTKASLPRLAVPAGPAPVSKNKTAAAAVSPAPKIPAVSEPKTPATHT
jgi:carbon storage regulator